jgi:hypothetical protein
LGQKTDKVTVSIELLHDVLMATGEMQFEFKYDDRWVLENNSVTTHFTSSYRPGAEHVLDESEAISAIASSTTNSPLEFGERNLNSRTLQTISVSAGEVSDFTVLSSAASNTATVQTYECAFTLNKNLVSFNASATLVYQYDRAGGWGIKNVTFLPIAVKAVKMEGLLGEWAGEYTAHAGSTLSGPYAFVLEITDVGSDGEITAIFHDQSANPYSVEMTGSFNSADLTFSMKSNSNGRHPFFNRIASAASVFYGYKREYDGGLMGYYITDSNAMKQYSAPSSASEKTDYFTFEITKN